MDENTLKELSDKIASGETLDENEVAQLHEDDPVEPVDDDAYREWVSSRGAA